MRNFKNDVAIAIQFCREILCCKNTKAPYKLVSINKSSVLNVLRIC